MSYLPLVARICLSLIFLNAAYNHIVGFSGFVGFIGSKLPLAGLWAVGTIVFQVLGVLSLLLGYKARIGASLLIIFLIPASLIFHNFLVDGAQLNPFLKNIGLIGGLLMVIYAGAGPLSLDRTVNE